MSRSILPPTPDLEPDELRATEGAYSSVSTGTKPRDHLGKLSSLQVTFELPPSAITDNDAPQVTSGHSPVSPTAKVTYLQPSESVKARRRTPTTQQQKDAFTLPPPPTRTRRIIQMKPRPQEDAEETPTAAKGSSATSKSAGASGGVSKPAAKKQPSQTSAAGRKMARKTAHSLIERRRRSKMNEEFAVLKGLIPACEGDMHKLAILQASIEYVRYLEDCLTKLKAQHGQSSMTTPEFRLGLREEEEPYDENQDVDMTDTETPSLNQTQHPSPPFDRSRQHSYSSASTEHRRHYSFSTSANTSPAILPQGYACPESTSHSALTSPALRPQVELDHEASAALLMLNSDRRAMPSAPGRGMSVRDLLSS
ncbi:hypothetical protein F5Y18DRAFT_426835 [Xylariaceae sp. FL1019]|nr:hypothetical protein F5Y18DRAFT_426835 [Xylariaceae sp. FL1019]